MSPLSESVNTGFWCGEKALLNQRRALPDCRGFTGTHKEAVWLANSYPATVCCMEQANDLPTSLPPFKEPTAAITDAAESDCSESAAAQLRDSTL